MFYQGCGSFPGGLWGICERLAMLLDDVCRIVGAREWRDDWRMDKEGKVALLLEKGW